MLKEQEIADPQSCWNKARPGERVFVLLGHSKGSPGTIRYWVNERIKLGANQAGDPQMAEALECARLMEAEFPEIHQSANRLKQTLISEPGATIEAHLVEMPEAARVAISKALAEGSGVVHSVVVTKDGEQLRSGPIQSSYLPANSRLAALEAENARLRAALEWYAEPKPPGNSDTVEGSVAWFLWFVKHSDDSGARARAALATETHHA